MHFTFVFLSLLGVSLSAILGINIYKDEEGWLWRGYARERWMAAQMLNGYDIAGRQDFRIRALVTEVIGQRTTSPDVVVLGSSRALLVGETLLGLSGVSNHSVSSARLVHYMSVLGLYQQRGMLPQVVLIGVDPWIFKDERLVIWPMEQGAYTVAERLHINITKLGMANAGQWQGYFSGDKAWKSINALGSAQGNCGTDIPLQGDASACAVRRHDGSLKYPADEMARSAESVAKEVLRSARGRMHSYDGYRELDLNKMQALRQFLGYLQAQGVYVELFLAPYHPLVELHQKGKRDWRLTMEAEITIRDIAQNLNIPVSGAYSAAEAGCTAEEFYDGIHARESCIQRILAPFINRRSSGLRPVIQ